MLGFRRPRKGRLDSQGVASSKKGGKVRKYKKPKDANEYQGTQLADKADHFSAACGCQKRVTAKGGDSRSEKKLN